MDGCVINLPRLGRKFYAVFFFVMHWHALRHGGYIVCKMLKVIVCASDYIFFSFIHILCSQGLPTENPDFFLCPLFLVCTCNYFCFYFFYTGLIGLTLLFLTIEFHLVEMLAASLGKHANNICVCGCETTETWQAHIDSNQVYVWKIIFDLLMKLEAA